MQTSPRTKGQAVLKSGHVFCYEINPIFCILKKSVIHSPLAFYPSLFLQKYLPWIVHAESIFPIIFQSHLTAIWLRSLLVELVHYLCNSSLLFASRSTSMSLLLSAFLFSLLLRAHAPHLSVMSLHTNVLRRHFYVFSRLSFVTLFLYLLIINNF